MRADNKELQGVEMIISKALRAGVVVSGTVIFIGLLIFLLSGNSGYPESVYPSKPSEIIRGLLELKSYAVIMTGIMILIATPVFRVGVSIIVFAVEKDYLYVKITTVVFLILIVSMVLGKVG